VQDDGGHDEVGASPAVLVDEMARQRREDELADTGAAQHDRRGERSPSTEVDTDDHDRRKMHHAEPGTYTPHSHRIIPATKRNNALKDVTKRLVHLG